MSQQVDLMVQANAEPILFFIGSGLQQFVSHLTQSYVNKAVLFADDYYSLLNTQFIEGFLVVGKIKSQFNIKLNSISAENAFR